MFVGIDLYVRATLFLRVHTTIHITSPAHFGVFANIFNWVMLNHCLEEFFCNTSVSFNLKSTKNTEKYGLCKRQLLAHVFTSVKYMTKEMAKTLPSCKNLDLLKESRNYPCAVYS